MKKSAFTLVELMVAMAIIGVLLGLAVFGVSAAQKAQRNTERKAALQDINLGIQTYIDSFGAYPSGISFDATHTYIGATSSNCTAANCKTVPIKGAATPSVTGGALLTAGPLNSPTTTTTTKYFFVASCSGGGYYLAACLEDNAKPFEVSTCSTAQTYTCP